MISTIITTYGGGSQLQRAIESVFAQTYKDIEIIVVDDNNPNTSERQNTERVMQPYISDERVIYIKHEWNKNGSAARNTGIKAAQGEYISFLDDDDYYLPDRFTRIISVIEASQDYVGVYTGYIMQDENGNEIIISKPKKELTIRELLLNEMAHGTGSNLFIKTSVAKAIGGFDESFIRWQDIEFMIRVCECGRVGYIEDCLVVKAHNGVSNLPGYEKMRSVSKQFTNKFKNHIEELGEETNLYYYNKQENLFRSALRERNPEAIKEEMNLIRKYGKITVKERILAFLYIYNIRDNRIVDSIIQIKNKIRYKLTVKY